jgi:thiol-disulfide isomerase/thioredoxin
LDREENSNETYLKKCKEYLYCQYKLQRFLVKNDDIDTTFINDSNYLTDHNFRDLLVQKEYYLFLKQYNDPNKQMVACFSSALLKKGKIKDYLLYYALSWMKSKNQSLFKQYFSKFLTECKNPIFSENLNDEMVRISNSNFNKECINYSINDKLAFRDILEKNKGRIVVVDFWASWCMPCRASMQELPKIWAKYSNSLISFVYISIDEKKAAWMAAVKEENLSTQKDNYLISDPNNSTLLKQYSIKEIPRYLIFNKDGKIIQLNAPSPESKEFETVLSKLL